MTGRQENLRPRHHLTSVFPVSECTIRPVSVPCPKGCQCRKCIPVPERGRYRKDVAFEVNEVTGIACPHGANGLYRRPVGSDRARTLWTAHRMRPGDWDAMWKAQRGCCYLCGDPLPANRRHVHIDHDHSCCPPGKSCATCRRGLACHPCNTLIGHAQDDPARLRRIADRLEFAKATVSFWATDREMV